MTTGLDNALKREIIINGEPFVVTLTPEGFKLIGKGRRKGLEIAWADLISGEAALARALSASITGDMRSELSANNATKQRQGARAHRRKPATRRRTVAIA